MYPHHYETWQKLKYNCYQFYIDDVINDTKGIFVILQPTDIHKKITIVFDSSLFSCRGTQRNYYPKRSFETGIYEKEDSQYLAWLRKESDGVYENEYNTMKHYIFVGYNIVFEILTLAPSTIQINT